MKDYNPRTMGAPSKKGDRSKGLQPGAKVSSSWKAKNKLQQHVGSFKSPGKLGGEANFEN